MRVVVSDIDRRLVHPGIGQRSDKERRPKERAVNEGKKHRKQEAGFPREGREQGSCHADRSEDSEPCFRAPLEPRSKNRLKRVVKRCLPPSRRSTLVPMMARSILQAFRSGLQLKKLTMPHGSFALTVDADWSALCPGDRVGAGSARAKWKLPATSRNPASTKWKTLGIGASNQVCCETVAPTPSARA